MNTDTQTPHRLALLMLFGLFQKTNLFRACIWNNCKPVYLIKIVWPTLAKMIFSETNKPGKLTVPSLVHRSKRKQRLETVVNGWGDKAGGQTLTKERIICWHFSATLVTPETTKSAPKHQPFFVIPLFNREFPVFRHASVSSTYPCK